MEEIQPASEGLYLWQGDITTLRCDAIVNAANSGMTGCYVPNPVQTVKGFMEKGTSVRKVIFNVFKDLDKEIYRKLL